MAGDGGRRGAVRKPGTKKGPTRGTGGHGRRALEGKGPTPKAEDRPYHPAAKRKAQRDRAASRRRKSAAQPDPRQTSGNLIRPQRTAGSEVIAGRNAVVEALEAQIPAATLYLAHGIESDDRVKRAVKLAGEARITMLETARADLDKFTDNAVHQGLALQVPPYEYAHPRDLLVPVHEADTTPLIVSLDGVTDPRNLGAVLRSAGAFGVDGVIIPERRAAGVTTAAFKVSAGAAARVPVARATNLTRALQDFRKAGYFIVGLDAGGTVGIADVELATEPLVLVIGSEGKGLSRLVREQCDLVASIPIAAETESLNAAVAGGIALYEVDRRRRAAQ
ncbi:MAG TPA: 23S rRNA (guanosine(2251)-2'-O)-methyltransferase RlmB [Actinomycetales bacterium]|nr:23S rRNA (guanosine(2251)-2'-O)-methyltransferase RlmB [Actinomycetales bacterium]